MIPSIDVKVLLPEDGVIRVVSLDQLTKEKEAQARVEAAKRNAEIETRTKLAEAQLKETELATKKLAADAAAAEQAARGPLREEVIPLYYQRDQDGLPRGWIKRMKRTIRTLGWRFNADRMVMDYTVKCYVPAAGGISSEMRAT